MNDEKFKALLSKSSHSGDGGDGVGTGIGSIEGFTEWKSEFLSELREFLDPVGTATAREADEELYAKLEGLARSCLSTKTLCREGKIGVEETTTVAGRKALSELMGSIKTCEEGVESYVPKTTSQASKAGYTKFDLAAVAIRDGFRVYGLMCATRDYLAGLVSEGGPLEGVLRDNQLATTMYYFRCLEAFAETMADLGIYKVMEECVEVYKVRPRGKKKKRPKRKGSNYCSDDDDDALALSSDEERTLRKLRKKKQEEEDDDPEDGILNGGRMFAENKNPAGKKTRAIMDKGWSNGFAPGEEVSGPDGGAGGKGSGKKPRSKQRKASKKKPSKGRGGGAAGGGGTASSPPGDGDPVDGSGRETRGVDEEDDDDRASGDPSRSKSKRSSSDGGKDGDDDDDDDDDGNSSTEPTDDDDDDEHSSSDEEDDDEEEEDYIYYFDPVQKVVGKLRRSDCVREKLIVTSSGGTETLEGVVDHWETRKEKKKNDDDAPGDDGDADEEEIPGKTDLLRSMKEVLIRGGR